MTCTDTCLDWEPKIQISHNCQWLFSNFMTHFFVSKEEKHKQCNRYQRIKLLTLGYLMLVYGSVHQFILGILSNQTVECTATHKQWCALHHLRHRMPCLQTPHIHHSFCFMTAFQLTKPYPHLPTLPLHTTSLWNTAVPIYLLIPVQSSFKEMLISSYHSQQILHRDCWRTLAIIKGLLLSKWQSNHKP